MAYCGYADIINSDYIYCKIFFIMGSNKIIIIIVKKF